MYWSRLFIPTLRENPAGIDSVALQLLMRAGYARPLSGGGFGYLFAGQRALAKISGIAREEMTATGGQEIAVPSLDAATAADLAGGELRSPRQLPQIWFQIRPKSRAEGRTKAGTVRVRHYLTLNSHSFGETGQSYARHSDAFARVLDRCGLRYTKLEDALAVKSDGGDDEILECSACGMAASMETAVTRAQPPAVPDPERGLEPEAFHTPGMKTIADVAEFTGLPETSQMKSLVMVAGSQPVLAMVRGDHQMSENKFAAVMGGGDIRAAYGDEIPKWFGADAGSLGPVGVANLRVVADRAIEGRRNMICGANRNDYHLRNVTPGEDFQPEYFDLRQAAAGDLCMNCEQPVDTRRVVTIARFSKTGAYELAIERVLSVAVELHADKDGIVLPRAIAPFEVVVTPVNMNVAEQRDAGEAIYRACAASGLDAVLDDRDERPGVKFKDSDLTGIPWRVTIGKKLPQGIVEVVERRTRQSSDVRVEEVAAFLNNQ